MFLRLEKGNFNPLYVRARVNKNGSFWLYLYESRWGRGSDILIRWFPVWHISCWLSGFTSYSALLRRHSLNYVGVCSKEQGVRNYETMLKASHLLSCNKNKSIWLKKQRNFFLSRYICFSLKYLQGKEKTGTQASCASDLCPGHFT
jgi:hypothetical protein